MLAHTAKGVPTPVGNGGVCTEKRLTGTFYRGAAEGLGNEDIVAAIGAM